MPRSEKPVRVERGLYLAGKTYLACVTPPGRRTSRWRTLGEVGKMEARRLRDAFAVEVGSNRVPEGADARATFSQVADAWLDRQRQLQRVGELAPRTLEAYETAARLHLVPYFAARRVRSLGPEDLVRWHASQRAAGAAAWSIKARWTALRGILAHAARYGALESNPADLLERRERPPSGEPRRRFLTDSEMRKLMVSAAPRWQPLIAVCLFAGLRISEALGLAWEDVDFAAGVIRVRFQRSRKDERVRMKTSAGRRDVVMMPALARVLREEKLAAPFSGERDPVFATGNRTSVSQRNATRAIAKVVSDANLDGVTFHALRHTFASLLIAQRRDPVFVADQLGHADPGITLRAYAHLFRGAREAGSARDQLDAEYGHILRGSGS